MRPGQTDGTVVSRGGLVGLIKPFVRALALLVFVYTF